MCKCSNMGVNDDDILAHEIVDFEDKEKSVF